MVQIDLKDLPQNWPGLWYKEGQKRGVNSKITCFKVNLNNSEVLESYNSSHIKVDGIGTILHLLNQHGKNVKLSSNNKIKKMTFTDFFQYVISLLFTKSSKKIDWTYWQEDNQQGNKSEFHFHVFSKEETGKIVQVAKNKDVSLTSHALSIFNSHIFESLISKKKCHQWMIPINLRGHVESPHLLSNQVAAIFIDSEPKTTDREFHQKLKFKLSHQMFWPSWFFFNIGKVIGFSGVKLLAKFLIGKTQYLGNFTNIGSWETHNKDEAFCIFPPGSSNFPIGIILQTMNEQLIITMRMHQSINKNKDFTKNIFAQIISDLR